MEQINGEYLIRQIRATDPMILVKENGNFIEFMDPNMLTANYQYTADLVLSAGYGYPCEALRKAVNDEEYLKDVAKCIVLKDRTALDWVVEHMFRNDEEVRAILVDFLARQSLEKNFGEEKPRTL